jgi:hypothetical protein
LRTPPQQAPRPAQAERAGFDRHMIEMVDRHHRRRNDRHAVLSIRRERPEQIPVSHVRKQYPTI